VLQLLTSALVSLWVQTTEVQSFSSPTTYLYGLKDILRVTLTKQSDSLANATVKHYLQQLVKKGGNQEQQGIWLQSGTVLLMEHQGTKPLPVASLTKVATTLAALETWGPNHQFVTTVRSNGTVRNGVLTGDLIIQGGGDPLFTWEDGIALGNGLQQLGIQTVKGKLVITNNFAMNFSTDGTETGNFLRQALDSKRWSSETQLAYGNLPKDTPKPQVKILGSMVYSPGNKKGSWQQNPLIMERLSVPLKDILKSMNIYSNNFIADTLAELLGGAGKVAQKSIQVTRVPTSEIQLINGSGLGSENRISPRAVCALLIAIQQYLESHGLNVGHIFPIVQQDKGTIEDRAIPRGAVLKTGTLWDVSTLAGAFPTRDRGLIWFTFINRGSDLDGFRKQQDQLLQSLTRQWGVPLVVPELISDHQPHPRPDYVDRNQLTSTIKK